MVDPTSQVAKTPPRRAPRVRERRQKSVTFAGCWTCRARKVKCDERRENGCLVCEKARLHCAGYEVSLCWMDGSKKDGKYQRRRKIQSDRSRTLCISEDEIARMLSKLDTASSAAEQTASVGPFTMFRADELEPDRSPSDGRNRYLLINNPIRSASSDEASDQNAETLDPNRLYEYDSTALVLAGFANESGLEETFQFDPSASSLGLPTPGPKLALSRCQDRDTSMLMHHYANHVAELLQPVLHPGNPWRTTYFQFALEGRDDLAVVRTTSSQSMASAAIFHSILSSASFHLRNSTESSKKYHELGLQHRAKSLEALHAALVHPRDSQVHTVYLTAMLSLVTIDTITGEDADYLVHLNGCQQLQEPHGTGFGDQTSQVRSICHFLTLLARTTSPKHLLLPYRRENLLWEAPLFNGNDRDIEYIYGITASLGNMLHRVCQLSESVAYYRGHDFPAGLSDACRALRSDLLQWWLGPEQFLVSVSGKTMIQIARCQARAFHNAVVIYFYRTTGTDGRSSLDYEVNMVLENLTHAEDLKDLHMSGEKRTAPMSWPAFIAACEATDRRPWTQWWTRVQSYKIGNFVRQWKVIQELWEIMDNDDSMTDWKLALEKSGKLVLPI